MIRVTLEMVSARGPEYDRVLGVGHIANAGPSAAGTLYQAWFSKTIPGQTTRVWKQGRLALSTDLAALADAEPAEIPDFDNVQRGAWDLLFLGLRAIVGKRNLPAPSGLPFWKCGCGALSAISMDHCGRCQRPRAEGEIT